MTLKTLCFILIRAILILLLSDVSFLAADYQRIYDARRNPSFCDRILVANHNRNIRLQSIAYDSISTGVMEYSDHDLVYQLIRVSSDNTPPLFAPKMMLMVTWNFGETHGEFRSYVPFVDSIQTALQTRHNIWLGLIDVVYFSFQESTSLHFDEFIHVIHSRYNIRHIQTVESGSLNFKVYGLLFIRDHNIRYMIGHGKPRTLTIQNKFLFFTIKSAAFTSVVHFENAFDIMFIATHFPTCKDRNQNEQLIGSCVEKRLNALRAIYDKAGGQRNLILMLAGDLNFRQTFANNLEGIYLPYSDQLYHNLCHQNSIYTNQWRELENPKFSASCKRVSKPLK